jgi:hypothetical protein
MQRIITFTTLLFLTITLFAIQCSRKPDDQHDGFHYLPEPQKLQGWKPVGSPQRFMGEELYVYMNGGAGIYHSYGFKKLIAQEYINQNSKTIALEIFEMENSSGAYGIYTSKIGNDGKVLPVGSEASLEDYYLNFWKGNFLVTLTGFDSAKDTVDGLMIIAHAVDENLI